MAKKRISIQAAKAKGRKFQQWVASEISRITGLPWGPDEPIASREMGQNGVDIRLVGEAKEICPYSVECKRCEKWKMREWIKQAQDNCMKSTDWVLFIRSSRERPIAVIDAAVFFRLTGKFKNGEPGLK